MPKPYQGVAVAESVKRIELSYLFKSGLIVKGRFRSGILKWTNRNNEEMGRIWVRSRLTDEEKWVELQYTFTNNYTGEKCAEKYKVYLVGIPSNLGKGEVYYFECPSTLRLCRVLYSAYGGSKFKSRFAYRYPIYYQCQVCSKNDYWNTRYFKAVDQLEKMRTKRTNSTYKGKVTASKVKLHNKEIKVMQYDRLRWGYLAVALQKLERKGKF